MRHFAESLGKDGIAVRYRRLDDADNAGSLAGEVAAAIAVFAPDRIVVTAPGEYRLADEMAGWQARFGLAVDIRADTRFLCSLGDFAEWAEGRKSLRMEFFYRDLRRRYQVLMANGIMMPIIASRQRPDWLCRRQAALHPMRSQPRC
jgi:deoxyribodipyrimidine photolyase-related protein